MVEPLISVIPEGQHRAPFRLNSRLMFFRRIGLPMARKSVVSRSLMTSNVSCHEHEHLLASLSFFQCNVDLPRWH